MRYITLFLVSWILIFTIPVNPEKNEMEKNIKIITPKISFLEKDGFVMPSANTSFLYSPGKPVLPQITKVIKLPFGIKIKNIVFKIGEKQEKSLSHKIIPSNGPVLISPYPPIFTSYHAYMDKNTYGSEKFYPYKNYDYRIGCGMDEKGRHVTFLAIHFYPLRYSPALNKVEIVKKATIKITYTPPEKTLPSYSQYKMVIITPPDFKNEAERLAQHKNEIGIPTFVKTTDEIYSSYSGRDEPEKIKYFIKDSIEKYGIKYVLLFGGLKSKIYARARDNPNAGIKSWYVPVRYTNIFDNPKYPLAEVLHDPGFVSDLYYADIYKYGGKFDDWDSNGDDIFISWNRPGVEDDNMPDLYPDVYVGRLACRSINEAKIVVDKIINYEEKCDESWFKRIMVVSGDGFLDQTDLNITWDTKSVDDGRYTIYAQSMNDDGEYGPVDEIHITVDRSRETKITFNHDDHLNPALQNGYPAPPIAEIVSISDGDILGNTDYTYNPSEGEAYCNEFFHWANISYVNGVLTIRGKSYDPEPYGNITSIHVWIEDSNGNIVFQAWRNNTEMYYEGEWTTGEKKLEGRGGALYYMPSDFERTILWGSNGKFTGQDDVLNAWNDGYGFVFMSGHGSPNVWADHLPGIPGNRQHSSLLGMQVTSLKPWFPYISFPVFPADSLKNGEKLPVAVLGGCHNSQFNVSAIPAFLNVFSLLTPWDNYMWTYGQPVPECLSWRLVVNPHGGSIASIGNTGLGYGMPGRACTTGGGDSWITIEFFHQYGNGRSILGEAHGQAITSYINTFDMSDMEAGHVKTVAEWALLGDPSLMMGGYS